jgi:DNA-binding CsgD family transcriptional regulator/Tfp pilus assembly protein PilF
LLERLNQRLLELGGGPRDAPSRHQTMRDTIAWSYDLLDPADQSFFGKLGVFSGGWTVEAAYEVAGFGKDDPLDALSRLIDVSLVLRMHDAIGGARFTMLETIREYALEILALDGLIHDVEARHTWYYLTMAEQAKELIAGPDQVFWLSRLDAEQDNIRRVVDRAINSGDAPTALRLGAALWRYWGQRGQLSEGRSALERALVVDSDVEHSLRAAATYHLANLALDLMEYAAARNHLGASLALFRQLGDLDGIASSLNSLGLVAWCTGEYATALAHFIEAERIWKSINDLPGVAAAQHNLGWLAAKEGQYQQARKHHEEALRLRRVQKDNDAIAYSIWALGAIALYAGDVERAQTLCKESLALFTGLGDRQGEAYVLHELARAAQRTAPAVETLRRYHDLLVLRQDLGERNGVIESFEEIAGVLAGQRIMEPAARLLGAASAMRASFSLAPWVAERLAVEQTLVTLQRALPKDAFDAAWNTGQTWTFDRAMNEALTFTRVSLQQPPDATPFNLTRREQEILRLLNERRTDPEIAAQLFISTKTASNHVYNILSKLGAKNRREAAEFAKKHALI